MLPIIKGMSCCCSSFYSTFSYPCHNLGNELVVLLIGSALFNMLKFLLTSFWVQLFMHSSFNLNSPPSSPSIKFGICRGLSSGVSKSPLVKTSWFLYQATSSCTMEQCLMQSHLRYLLWVTVKTACYLGHSQLGWQGPVCAWVIVASSEIIGLFSVWVIVSMGEGGPLSAWVVSSLAYGE